MTSYFEIGGHIVECHEVLTSPELRDFVTEVSSVSHGISEGYKSAAPSSKSGGKDKDSLFTHWLKTITYPTRKLAGPDLLFYNPITSPRGFILKSIGIGIGQVEMHYDYFVKGESHDW